MSRAVLFAVAVPAVTLLGLLLTCGGHTNNKYIAVFPAPVGMAGQRLLYEANVLAKHRKELYPSVLSIPEDSPEYWTVLVLPKWSSLRPAGWYPLATPVSPTSFGWALMQPCGGPFAVLSVDLESATAQVVADDLNCVVWLGMSPTHLFFTERKWGEKDSCGTTIHSVSKASMHAGSRVSATMCGIGSVRSLSSASSLLSVTGEILEATGSGFRRVPGLRFVADSTMAPPYAVELSPRRDRAVIVAVDPPNSDRNHRNAKLLRPDGSSIVLDVTAVQHFTWWTNEIGLTTSIDNSPGRKGPRRTFPCWITLVSMDDGRRLETIPDAEGLIVKDEGEFYFLDGSDERRRRGELVLRKWMATVILNIVTIQTNDFGKRSIPIKVR